MSRKRSHLDEKWYVVGLPWGDSTEVIAGHNDPNIGLHVCDCQVWEDLGEIYAFKWNVATPQQIAQRIADDHNEVLRLRRKVAELEKRLEKRSAQQDIEELFGAQQ